MPQAETRTIETPEGTITVEMDGRQIIAKADGQEFPVGAVNGAGTVVAPSDRWPSERDALLPRLRNRRRADGRRRADDP